MKDKKEYEKEYDYEFEYEGEKVQVGAHTVIADSGVVNQYVQWKTGEWNGEYGYVESGRVIGPYLVFGEDPQNYPTNIHNGTADSIEIPEDIFKQLVGDHEKQLYDLRRE
ncbi:hypothetical protein [Halalkalicoccus jeotgali]|uniref:hypothetical protein n=1 Tax=Halalkalicoccus jeotgali TaxID=413810 RepID=UPI00067775C5|nr:hypothetical protein [Halalkalicoccus jeotgali]